MKPFFSFYGAKYRAALHTDKPLEGSTIVEPFAGSAGYSTRYGADRKVILCDIDPVIAGLWRWLIDASPDDVMAISSDADEVLAQEHSPQRDLVGFWSNKGSASPAKSRSAWAKTPKWATQFWGPKIQARIAEQVTHIKQWEIIKGSYTDCPDIRATWYVDPPYQSKAGKAYKHNFRDFNFSDLGEWCLTRQGRLIVCEQEGAMWLPFEPWRTLHANQGGASSDEVKKSKEVQYRKDN